MVYNLQKKKNKTKHFSKKKKILIFFLRQKLYCEGERMADKEHDEDGGEEQDPEEYEA
jgi:hypothetical protein